MLLALSIQKLFNAALPLLKPPLLLRHPLVRLRLFCHHDLLQCLLAQRLVEVPNLLNCLEHLHERAGLGCKTRSALTLYRVNADTPSEACLRIAQLHSNNNLAESRALTQCNGTLARAAP